MCILCIAYCRYRNRYRKTSYIRQNLLTKQLWYDKYNMYNIYRLSIQTVTFMKLHEAWLSLSLSIPLSVPACTHPSVWSASHTNDRKPVYQPPPSDIRHCCFGPNHHLAVTFASWVSLVAKHVSDGWQSLTIEWLLLVENHLKFWYFPANPSLF